MAKEFWLIIIFLNNFCRMSVQQLNHKQKVLTIIFSLELWRANKQNIHGTDSELWPYGYKYEV
ncbi:hypothetical protein GLYMA_08G152851v4 [Glycine max]|nr:hypothetical protein GLYMA_08G152851v4 [Glycine max]KAH1051364.1 hypothetical protein GYH30_021328 [Glycine max]